MSKEYIESMVERLLNRSPNTRIEDVESILGNILEEGIIEIGGEQYPVSVASVVLNTQQAYEAYERMMTQREKIISLKNEQKSSKFQPKHIENIERMRNRPLWRVICPEHGEVDVIYLTKSGFRAMCGCFASLEIFKEKQTGFTWYESNDKSTTY
jgi:hypothetical protein